jgi:membrane protease subunit (stomatin/prohibitin family)
MGAQLTVRESQVALFINEGEIADVYEPGRYELTTENMPILTKLKSWPYGFNSPFKAEVYFVNTKQFLDQKWGTTNPLMMRDAEFGIIRLRGFGTFAYRVTDPVQFMREVFGTKQFADTDIITPQLKQQILTAMADLLGEAKIPALDLISNYEELAKLGAEKVQPQFAEYGLTLTNLTIQNLSLPKEVEDAMDKRTQMGVLGNLDTYTKFQVAESIRDAAQNEGGMAGIGASLGVGALSRPDTSKC